MSKTPTEKTNEYNEKRKRKGLEINRGLPLPDNDIDYFKIVKVDVDWSSSYSKNVILGRGNFGKRYFMKKRAKDLKSEIFYKIKDELNKTGMKFVNDKVWLDIFVQKPNAGAGDAINVIDLIADGVSEAIGVDDRWFSIKSLDWQIKKENPKVFIEFGQADNIPKKICSYCGRILPLDCFNKSKAEKDGHIRRCKECMSIK